jgi:hypothetical protein
MWIVSVTSVESTLSPYYFSDSVKPIVPHDAETLASRATRSEDQLGQ